MNLREAKYIHGVSSTTLKNWYGTTNPTVEQVESRLNKKMKIAENEVINTEMEKERLDTIKTYKDDLEAQSE